MSDRDSLFSFRRAIRAARRGYVNNEAAWSFGIGAWEIGAGFFKGFGVGVTVQSGEWDLTLGCFAIGGVRD